MSLDQKYPSIEDLERRALRRMPRFAAEYLRSGIGREAGLAHNRAALDAVKFDTCLLPERGCSQPDTSVTLFGRRYDQPFGITPLGLSGLMWPRAVEILARAAVDANIPMGLSHHATTHLSDFRAIAGENGWFQMYPPHDAEIRRAMLAEAAAAGFEVLIVTIDVPASARRDRDLRVDLSVPPRITLRTLWDVATHPAWALATARIGAPRFPNFEPYLPKNLGLAEGAHALVDLVGSHVTQDMLRDIRAHWPGKLVIKGILNAEDARTALDCGADGLWVSNHGARQLDAYLSPVEILPKVREAIGWELPLMADSGPRNGLDIARLLALGADCVFLGRAFIFGVGALGARGGDHAVHILRQELRGAMVQIGCETPADLRRFVIR